MSEYSGVFVTFAVPWKIRRYIIALHDLLCDTVALIRGKEDIGAAMQGDIGQQIFISLPDASDESSEVIDVTERAVLLIAHVIYH